jgi:hypothetical protein
MDSGETSTQLFIESALFGCRIEELKSQEIGFGGHHFRHSKSIRLSQPAKTACLAREHFSRSFGSSLHEQTALIVENHLVGSADISTG